MFHNTLTDRHGIHDPPGCKQVTTNVHRDNISPAIVGMVATSFRPGSCGQRQIQLNLVNIQSQIV